MSKLQQCISQNHIAINANDKKILKWVFANETKLMTKFKKLFPQSPFDYTVQIPYNDHFKLLRDDASIRKVDKVSYLKWSTLTRLGCPKLLKNKKNAKRRN